MMNRVSSVRRLGRALLTLTFCCAALPAAAQFSVGVGAGLDHARVDCVAPFACDRSDAHVKLHVGWRVAEAADLQLLYFDAGRFHGGDRTSSGIDFGGRFKVSGVGLTVGYRWELAAPWSFVARAGVARVRTSFDYADPYSGSVSETTTQPIGQLGLAYALTPALRLSLDVDVSRFKVHTTHGTVTMFGVGAEYAF